MSVALWLQSNLSMGSGGPRVSVVKTGASNCDISDGTSTIEIKRNSYFLREIQDVYNSVNTNIV